MFALLRKSRQLQLTIDVQFNLFDALAKPVLFYGNEVWAHETISVNQLSVNKSTCTNIWF